MRRNSKVPVARAWAVYVGKEIQHNTIRSNTRAAVTSFLLAKQQPVFNLGGMTDRAFEKAWSKHAKFFKASVERVMITRLAP